MGHCRPPPAHQRFVTALVDKGKAVQDARGAIRSTAATSVANNISRRRADSVTANSYFRAILHNHKRRAPATVWRITAQLARCRYIVLLDEVERRHKLG